MVSLLALVQPPTGSSFQLLSLLSSPLSPCYLGICLLGIVLFLQQICMTTLFPRDFATSFCSLSKAKDTEKPCANLAFPREGFLILY